MTEFLRNLDLRGVTFFEQDWGGLIGLRVITEEPDRFSGIMISNTGLPAAGGVVRRRPAPTPRSTARRPPSGVT